MLSLLIVFMFVPLTRVSCFQLTSAWRLVISPWIMVMSPAASPTAFCRAEMSPLMLLIAVATAQFWIAFVEAVLSTESTVGLFIKSV